MEYTSKFSTECQRESTSIWLDGVYSIRSKVEPKDEQRGAVDLECEQGGVEVQHKTSDGAARTFGEVKSVK